MSKHSNPSDEVPLLRHSRRRAGFRIARPVSDLVQPSSSNSSLFVTVHEERRGSLKAHSRLLSPTLDPSTRASTPTAQSNTPETAVEHTFNDNVDSHAQAEPTPQVEDHGAKRKRKRRTNNVVCSSSKFLCAMFYN
jgi:hypothetical protein